MSNKTVPEGLQVDDYMAAISDPHRRSDCAWLLQEIRAMTGKEPKLWGGTLKSAIVGFGDYHYKYESGREGDYFRLGFANRAANITVYIMPGYQNFDEELSRLGKHKMGKSCLYIKRLSDVDTDVLKEIMQKGLDIMAERYPE
jgi:hypothetical protein